MLIVQRSDKYPVGTVVRAFPGGFSNRHHEGKPSGESVASATVAANGSLSFPTLEPGPYVLWAEVGGAQQNLAAYATAAVPPRLAGTLLGRVRAVRTRVGA